MEEQASLRGQGFTLAVFGGLAALFAFFFILGMIVGRGQGTRTALNEEVVPAAQPTIEENGDDSADEVGLDFYEAVTRDEFPPPARPEAEPRAERAAPAPPSTAPSTALPDTGGVAVLFQLGAFQTEQTAERVVSEAREKGFPALVMRPEPADESQLYRVQVGPYTSTDQAQSVREQLETAGYEVIIVR